MTIDELTKRIEQLQEQRQAIIIQANSQMGNIDGQIAILTEWIETLNNPDVEAGSITDDDS